MILNPSFNPHKGMKDDRKYKDMGDHKMTLATQGIDNYILYNVQRQVLYGRKNKMSTRAKEGNF